MEASTFFITAVFFLGASVGGLLVSLQRQCTIERIKRDFESQLTTVVRESTKAAEARREIVPNKVAVTDPAEADFSCDSMTDEELSWEHLPVPSPDGNRPHAGF